MHSEAGHMVVYAIEQIDKSIKDERSSLFDKISDFFLKFPHETTFKFELTSENALVKYPRHRKDIELFLYGKLAVFGIKNLEINIRCHGFLRKKHEAIITRTL